MGFNGILLHAQALLNEKRRMSPGIMGTVPVILIDVKIFKHFRPISQ